jgi:hypothetical protein
MTLEDKNMLKGKTKALRALLAAASALALLLALLIPFTALAEYLDYDLTDPDDKGGRIVGTQTAPAEAAITKILHAPWGTTLPTTDFRFTIEPQEVNGKDYNASAATTDADYVPALIGTVINGSKTYVDISFSESIYVGADAEKKNGATYGDTTDGLTDYQKANSTHKWLAVESPNLLPKDDLTTAAVEGIQWTHAGEYVYLITETMTNANHTSDTANNGIYVDNNVNSDNKTDEWLTKSGAEYKLTVVVAEAEEDGKPTGQYYVKYVATSKEVEDNDNDISGYEYKVDATPGGDLTDAHEYYFSQLIFNNYYNKRFNYDDDDILEPENRPLAISKTVAGDVADKNKYFAFSVSVTTPVMSNTADGTDDEQKTGPYTAYIVYENDTLDEDDDDFATVITDLTDKSRPAITADNSATDGSITFYTGVEKTVYLKHGERLVFVDTPVGTAYTAEELAETDSLYTNQVKVTYDSQTSALSAIPDVDIVTGLGVNITAVTPSTVKDEEENEYVILALVSEGENKADFLNTDTYVPPTGILMNNLPYIGLIVLAAGGMALFIAFKARKRREESFTQ